jgi:hypothetical protein
MVLFCKCEQEVLEGTCDNFSDLYLFTMPTIINESRQTDILLFIVLRMH